MEIEIEISGKGKVKGFLDDRNPVTAKALYESLPLEGMAQLWYDEVYFPIPLDQDYENPSPSSNRGDLSYWPPGKAFCIFFGDSQPASEVNHIGRFIKNLELFSQVEDGDKGIVKRL